MELLERFVAGELDAFETLFRRFQGEIYRGIVRIVRDPAAAEDLTVETFWRIHRARGRFSPDRSFGAWAHRIATHVALDHLKTVRPVLALVEEPAGPDVPDGVQQQELAQAIRTVFAQLPPKLRVVATLALVEGVPQAKVAETLGISVGAVKSREFRAVRLLRKKLKRVGLEP